jgi:hypothetical protein
VGWKHLANSSKSREYQYTYRLREWGIKKRRAGVRPSRPPTASLATAMPSTNIPQSRAPQNSHTALAQHMQERSESSVFSVIGDQDSPLSNFWSLETKDRNRASQSLERSDLRSASCVQPPSSTERAPVISRPWPYTSNSGQALRGTYHPATTSTYDTPAGLDRCPYTSKAMNDSETRTDLTQNSLQTKRARALPDTDTSRPTPNSQSLAQNPTSEEMYDCHWIGMDEYTYEKAN